MDRRTKYAAVILLASICLLSVVWVVHLQFSKDPFRPLHTSPDGERVSFTTETVEEKWAAAGFSEESANVLTEESRARVDESDLAMFFTEYYIEDDSGFSVLIPEKVEEELTKTGKNLPGVLVLRTAVYQFAKKPDVPACLAVSRFNWERMPKYRGIDAMGMNRDVYSTVEIPGYVHRDTLYWEQQGDSQAVPCSEVDQEKDGGPYRSQPFLCAPAPKDSWGKTAFGWEGGVQYGVALKNGAYLPQSYALQVSFLHQTSAAFLLGQTEFTLQSSGFYRAQGKFSAIYQRISLVFGEDGLLC